ncbi:MAG: hypothetical protein QOF02_1928 [Blastocatellia bacterium]|jgi:ElaB/YqjD/DUF883 family membrane-anchored ribosome-binding protein|nr:hypothetical protein [Blastocatellia bacterium]
MSNRRAVTAAPEATEEPSKAQLQRQMEAARESIAQTVEDIKETVSDQVESVKETVSDVLDWNEHFTKNPLVWGAAAVGAGLVVGYSIAVMRQGEHHRKRRGAGDSVAEGLLGELANVGENILLPAVNDRIKQLFGIDLSEHLFRHETAKPRSASSRKSKKKSASKKGSAKKSAARKRATGK